MVKCDKPLFQSEAKFRSEKYWDSCQRQSPAVADSYTDELKPGKLPIFQDLGLGNWWTWKKMNETFETDNEDDLDLVRHYSKRINFYLPPQPFKERYRVSHEQAR
uniref:Uncharacterized protein n=1 Tax=Romanomermis culicivorax TaxID=13658 RepID=A0A915KAR3_ROMCU